MNAPSCRDRDALQQRRRRAARTALVVGLIALGIHVAFILSGVLSG